MALENKITIFSTFANDKLISESGALISEQKGGPAFYLKQALENERALFVLKTGAKMEVQILMTRKGEFGKVCEKLAPKLIHFSRIKTPFLLISSVLNEFDLTNLSTFKGKVFLDIQGYVRNGDDFGKKKPWNPSKEIMSNIFCLKGTKEELQNIPTRYIKEQKQKLLLITNGKHASEVFAFGKRYIVRPWKVVISKNTIGAGDTFFACFVSRFAKTAKALDSVRYATKRTSAFLR